MPLRRLRPAAPGGRAPDLRLPVTGDTSLAVYTDGEPGAVATVVLVHGFSTDASDWEPLMSHLLAALGVRTVRYDQRGHGWTRLGSKRVSVGLLADDLARVIDALAPHSRVVLVGHSMCGMSIMALAGAYPEWFGGGGRIAGVLLSSTCGRTRRDRSHALADRLRWWRRIRSWAERGAVLGRFALVAGCAMWARATPTALVGSFWRPLTTHDQTRALAALARARVHILVGARDRITPVHAARDLAAHIPGARLHIAHGGGHSLPEQRPRAIAGYLQDLLDHARSS